MKKSLIVVLSLMSLSSVASAADLGKCFPEKMAAAPAGSTCHTQTAEWRVEDETYLDQLWIGHGDQVDKRVYRDMRSGLKVTEPLTFKRNQYDADVHCSFGFRLPTGYPSTFNGKNGFPKQDSDFVLLEADGIRQAVPGIAGAGSWPSPLFWSSSITPNNSDNLAFDYIGEDGTIDIDNRHYERGSTICIK